MKACVIGFGSVGRGAIHALQGLQKSVCSFFCRGIHVALRISEAFLCLGDRVLVGLSGGPDSTALLLGLHQLRARLSITIGAAHLNHGLRGDLAARERWLVLNKIDLLSKEERKERIDRLIGELDWQGPVFEISAVTGEGTGALLQALMVRIEEKRVEESGETVDEDEDKPWDPLQ